MPGRKYDNGSGYRYGFNGQEKSGEIAEGLTTALYWEYDSRIGRRWNVDPVFKAWESEYSCFTNSPIWLNDVKGNIFDKATGSDKRADKVQGLANARITTLKKWESDADDAINTLKGKIADINAKVGTKEYSQEKADKEIKSLNKKIESKTSDKADFGLKIGYLTKSVTEIEKMKTDEETYIFENVTGNTGGTYRRASDRAIIMKVTSDENAVHELTHGMQVHNKIITGTGENDMMHTDIFGEEIEAYRRQYSLDPYSVKKQAPSYPRDARNINDINKGWLLGINDQGDFLYLKIMLGNMYDPKTAKTTIDEYNK